MMGLASRIRMSGDAECERITGVPPVKAGSPSRLSFRAPQQAGRPLAITAGTAVIRSTAAPARTQSLTPLMGIA